MDENNDLLEELNDLSELTTETEEEQEPFCLGTVVDITHGDDGGLQILPDGAEEAGEKLYKVNASAFFQIGDRVKIHRTSGTYIIEYPIGPPMSRYPIPSGGTDGQVLAKDGATVYKLKWMTVHDLPSGGSDGQVLMKDGSTAYQVKWGTVYGIPSGGTSGQVLVKNSATNYDAAWKSAGLPTGGTTGQVLSKISGTDYDVQWKTVDTLPSTTGVTTGYVLTKTASGIAWQAAPTELPSTGTTGYFLRKTASGTEWATMSVSSIANGTYNVSMNSSGDLVPSSNGYMDLGNSSYRFADLYARGNIYLGQDNTTCTLGFFGKTPVARRKVTTSDTLVTLIKALQNYGLINATSGTTPT